MSSQKGYCVVVDGYSAGNLLPGEFRARGFTSLHVQSTPEIWPILTLTYRPDDYEAHFAYDRDLAPLVEALRPYRPACVVAGTETGVELADRLGEALGAPGNGARKSEARRDKYLMIEAVRAHGLEVARQIQSASADEILAWVEAQGLDRVVVKPPKSAGTDSVAICRSRDEIRRAVLAIVGKTNQLGLFNPTALCQEFLEGTEFALDAVSHRGKAHFTAIWKYYKLAVNASHFVYDRDELVACDDATGKLLCDYVRGVLAALEITYGPSHTEVMLTADGPRLVEIGTRLNGVTMPKLHEACVGYGQLDLLADSYLDPAAFEKKSARPYWLRKHAVSVSLISDREGIVRGVPGQAVIERLPSFHEAKMRAKPGYRMRRTVDFYTNPGWINLVHPDADVIACDLATLRAIEQDGMYELDPLP